MTTAITHDQAIQTYKEHAAKLEGNYQALVGSLDAFMKNAKGLIEKKEHKKDEAKIHELEDQLKEM